MISSKKLVKMARKWQKLAAMGRKRISLPRNHDEAKGESCSTSKVADKGHFVVYTCDQRRFAIPLAYLNHDIFRKLLEMSEDEFGLPSAGPIILPCDAILVEYIISLIRQGLASDLQHALLTSIITARCRLSVSLHQELRNDQLLVH